MELQVPAAPRWLCLGWSSLFPHWDLGLWLNQCSQHSREPSPVPTLPPSRDEAMGSWEGDYAGQLIKISRETRGKKFWKGDLGSGNAWVGCGAFPIALGFFLHLFFLFYDTPFIPAHRFPRNKGVKSFLSHSGCESGPQLSRDSSGSTGKRCCSRKTAGKLQENQPGVTLRGRGP